MARTDPVAAIPALPVAAPYSVARLPTRRPTEFDLRPDAEAMIVVAGLIGVARLHRLRFRGRLQARPDGGWGLSGRLEATVEQPCRVTLTPVTTRIDEAVERRYLVDLAAPEAEEAALPEDVDAEPLPEVIDPAAVMVEALALAVPDFPRAPEAHLDEAVYTAPGLTPLRDADVHPMAGLAALRDRMQRR